MTIARALLSLLFLATGVLSGVGHARAEERFALLIGNLSYPDKVGPLKTPSEDVSLLAGVLAKLGFHVTVVKDAGYKAIDTALKTHIQLVHRAGKGTISLFYYSGHGASDPETQINYLIPVDVESADDADLWKNSFELNDIVSKLRDRAPEATHFIVFDGCRDELRLTRLGKKALGAEKGFTPVDISPGVMVAFSTAPGRTASDIGKTAGPYASALAGEIVKPGVEAVTMFRNVQLKVKQTIGQDPWLSFPTLPAIYFAGSQTPEEIEQQFWGNVKDSSEPAVIATYLARYPEGQFATLARALIGDFEQRARAEQARAVKMQRDQEEARKTAEVQRLIAEQRARDAELEQRRLAAEQKANTIATQQAQKLQDAEALVGADRMRKALEDLRVAKEMAQAAEEQRAAAAKAADEASKSAATILAARPAAAPVDERIVIAALPKLETTVQNFDGTWTLHNSSETCMAKGGQFKVQIKGSSVTVLRKAGAITGNIDSSGTIHWQSPALTDGYPVEWTGKLRGDTGSGTYVRRDRKCSGIFTARRD